MLTMAGESLKIPGLLDRSIVVTGVHCKECFDSRFRPEADSGANLNLGSKNAS